MSPSSSPSPPWGCRYDKIYSKGSDEWDSAEQEADYKKWGMDIMVTGGLAILMTAPIGLIIIQKLGPKWLEQDKSQGMEKSIDDMVAHPHPNLSLTTQSTIMWPASCDTSLMSTRHACTMNAHATVDPKPRARWHASVG